MEWVYVLRCADGSLYIGHTSNLADREATHNEGRGSLYTARRRPVRIVYSEPHETIRLAVARERQLKRWSRAKKEALISGDLRLLEVL